MPACRLRLPHARPPRRETCARNLRCASTGHGSGAPQGLILKNPVVWPLARLPKCSLASTWAVPLPSDRPTRRYLPLTENCCNNAAAVDEGHSYDAEELDPDSWDRQLRVNLRSVYYLSRLAIPHLRARGGGSIVNVSSVGSLVVWEKAAAYLTSKGAINQLTRSMAIDFQPDEIRVNAVLPGWIRTEIEEKRLAENPNAIEEALAVRSIRRLGKPSEIASAALFLASDDASYVTGTCLVVDGGWTLS